MTKTKLKMVKYFIQITTKLITKWKCLKMINHLPLIVDNFLVLGERTFKQLVFLTSLYLVRVFDRHVILLFKSFFQGNPW